MGLDGIAVILLQVALIGVCLWWLNCWRIRGTARRGRNPPRPPRPAPCLDSAPDAPVPFGRRDSWLAVRCEDPERVLAALAPGSRTAANWAAGGAACKGEDDRYFVSPCLDGFVLVKGDLPPGCLKALAPHFPEVQEFFCYQAAGCCHWAKYADGQCVREYQCIDGDVQLDRGDWTPEELALGFARFPRRGQAEVQDLPGEEDVLDLAAAWGVDPRFEKKTYPPATGWLCTW